MLSGLFVLLGAVVSSILGIIGAFITSGIKRSEDVRTARIRLYTLIADVVCGSYSFLMPGAQIFFILKVSLEKDPDISREELKRKEKIEYLDKVNSLIKSGEFGIYASLEVNRVFGEYITALTQAYGEEQVGAESLGRVVESVTAVLDQIKKEISTVTINPFYKNNLRTPPPGAAAPAPMESARP